MTLSDWIKDLKPARAAEILEVELQTVCAWRDYISLPKPEMMMKIVRMTHNLVSYEEIIESYFEEKEARS